MNKRLMIFFMLVLFVVGTGFDFTGSLRANEAFPGKVQYALATVGIVDVDDGNSVVKIMGNIHIPADRVVKKDVVAVMGNVKIDGQVNGNVVAVMGNAEINNIVKGDVISVMGNIKKGPNAQIYGDVVETSGPGLNLSPNKYFNLSPLATQHFNWGLKLFNLVILFALTSLVLALMPDKIKTMAAALGSDPLRKLLLGFIALILTPAVVLVTAISIIGLPLVPFEILAFIAGKFIGYVAAALYLGNRIRNTANLNINIFLELFLGVLTLWLVNQVPIVGFLLSVIITITALGLIIDTKFGTNRPWFKKKDYSPLMENKSKEDPQDTD